MIIEEEYRKCPRCGSPVIEVGGVTFCQNCDYEEL